MKIVHVIASIDPARGGPPGVVMRLAAAQAAMGHSVHLVSHFEAAAMERIGRAVAGVPGLERVERHLLPPPQRLDRMLAISCRPALRTIIGDAHSVHLHGIWEPILVQAATIARNCRVAYCVRPAGMLDPWSLRQKAWKKKLAMALVYRRVLDGAAFIHVLNDDEAGLIAPLGLRASSRTIPNGIFLEEIDPLPQPGTFATTVPALGGRRFILFLSRLHTKKGLDFLCAAFERLAREQPDVDLVVAGPEDGAGPSFRHAVEAAGLTGRVHMVGGLYGRDKLAALVDASCFCLPSRQEGFSVAITEALACRVPVVISTQCHFPEVDAVGAGIVVDLDEAAIARALSDILIDPMRAGAMGQAGRTLVERRFTWPAVARQTIHAYEAVAREEPPPVILAHAAGAGTP